MIFREMETYFRLPSFCVLIPSEPFICQPLVDEIIKKNLVFRIKAKSQVHQISDKIDHQGLRYKRF